MAWNIFFDIELCEMNGKLIGWSRSLLFLLGCWLEYVREFSLEAAYLQ